MLPRCFQQGSKQQMQLRVRRLCIRWETTTATEHQRPSPSTHGRLRSSERTFSSCSIQRAGFHTAQRGEKTPAVAKTKGENGRQHLTVLWRRMILQIATQKKNIIVELCLNEYRWGPHIGAFSRRNSYVRTLREEEKMCTCVRVRVILKNWTVAETIRAQVKAMHSLWQHRNRTLTWELAVFTFSQLSIGTRLLTNTLRRNGIKL